MRTFISPIGYDTRRVTRPVVNTGLGPDDAVLLLRPDTDDDADQAAQAVADVEQLLQEIEPAASCEVRHISTAAFEETVRECCSEIRSVADDRELIVSLGGGARDILLPLTISALVFAQRIDTALFFSDLDGTVQEWSLPVLTAQFPDRATATFEALVDEGKWVSLSTLADETGQSKSTVVRHVKALAESGVVETDTTGKAKQARVSFSGELCWSARQYET